MAEPWQNPAQAAKAAGSSVTAVGLLVLDASLFSRLRMRGLREALDHAEPPVPPGSEVGYGPAGLVETVGVYAVQNLPALFAPG